MFYSEFLWNIYILIPLKMKSKTLNSVESWITKWSDITNQLVFQLKKKKKWRFVKPQTNICFSNWRILKPQIISGFWGWHLAPAVLDSSSVIWLWTTSSFSGSLQSRTGTSSHAQELRNLWNYCGRSPVWTMVPHWPENIFTACCLPVV